MRILKLFFSLCLIFYFIIFCSCKKETEETPLPGTLDNPEENSRILDDFFVKNQPSKQFFEISSGTETVITGEKGTKITIPGNAFIDSQGKPVNGPVTFELKEVLSKRDMILSETPTITSDGELLVSGGVVYLNALQGADTLRLSQSVTVSVPTNSMDPEMSLFTGGIDRDGNFSWNQIDSSFFYQAVNNYLFRTDTLTWINIDKLPDFSLPLTTLAINMPDGFHQSAISSYLVLEDYLSVLSLQFGNSPQYSLDQIALNTNITVIFFGVKEGKFFSYEESFIVSDNLTITPVMEEASDEEINAILNSL